MTDRTREYLDLLLSGQNLSEQQAHGLMVALTDDALAPARAGALLAALRTKGETADEIRGFARALRELAIKPSLPSGMHAVDVVGTGGDNSGSLNLSTGAALLAVAAGATVVKHGNRAISSRSGSADLLEALGLRQPLDVNESDACLDATRFTFFFRPVLPPGDEIRCADPCRRWVCARYSIFWGRCRIRRRRPTASSALTIATRRA